METLYKHYLDSLPGYFTITDRNFRIIMANDRFRRDFGDYENRYCYQVYQRRSEKCETCLIEQTFRRGINLENEQTVKTLDGTEVSLINYTIPIRNGDGSIESVMMMSTDITEIKGLQQQLKTSQKRYKEIFERVPCYISIQDKDLNIIEANKLFKRDFGDLLRCKCYGVYKHREEECFPCAVQKSFQDGEVHQSEEVVTTKSGDRVNTLVYTAPVREEHGEIISVMEMSTNITQIRQLQSQLTSLGLLIGSISHGIKGLLNSLDGGVYLVNSGMKTNNQDRITQGWEMVQRNMERIRSMVLDILYYAKDREPDWEPIDAHEAVEEAAGMIETKATKKGVQVVRDFDEHAGTFEGDSKAIRSMLINLLENSLDAFRKTEKDKERIITIGVRGFNDHIEFKIQDNGMGMDQETREKAFSLFFSSKGVEGTGLGLFISNKIVLAHGGEIKIHSEVNEGSKFYVCIPRKRPGEQSEESYVL